MSDRTSRLGIAPVLPKFPHLFDRNESVPADLVGATIVQVGTYKDGSLVEGGGLVIDYIPVGESQTMRLSLALNDLAMWIVYHHPIQQSETA